MPKDGRYPEYQGRKPLQIRARPKYRKTATTLNIGVEKPLQSGASAEHGRHAEYRGQKAAAEKTAHTQNVGVEKPQRSRAKMPTANSRISGSKSRQARRNAGKRQTPSKTTNTLNIGVGKSLQSSRARKGLMPKNGGHAEYRGRKPL
eukprot:gene7300-370_t